MGSREQELHMAVRRGDAAKVEKLLTDGTDINCLFYGWTPLQLAIDIGNQDMATLLIDSGCNLEYHDSNTKAPFEEAVRKQQAKVVESLLKKKVCGDVVMTDGEIPLTYAVKKDSQSLLTVLLTGGVDVNRSNNYDQTAVHLAAATGAEDLVKLLIAAGADINCMCKESGNSTPLITAAANENENVVSLLAQQRNCKLNYQDSDGWTALWHAYSLANYDICTVLLRAGADKNIANCDGHTVVQDAADIEEEVMLELFQKYNKLF